MSAIIWIGKWDYKNKVHEQTRNDRVTNYTTNVKSFVDWESDIKLRGFGTYGSKTIKN